MSDHDATWQIQFLVGHSYAGPEDWSTCSSTFGMSWLLCVVFFHLFLFIGVG